MKKKILTPVLVLLILACAAAAYYMTPRTFGKNVNPADVDHINVFDGNTGTGFTIDNPEDIRYIVENIQSQSMKRDGISLGYMGYSFKISYIDAKDRDVIPLFYLNSDNTIRKDPFFYRCDGGLCFDYLKGLELALSADTAPSYTAVLHGTILEINNGTLLVTPLEGEDELNSSDKFTVSMDGLESQPAPEVGDLVKITYNGDIMETYPASLGGVSRIDVIKTGAGTEESAPCVTIEGVTYYDIGRGPLEGLPEGVSNTIEQELPLSGGAYGKTARSYAIEQGTAYLLVDGTWFAFEAE